MKSIDIVKIVGFLTIPILSLFAMITTSFIQKMRINPYLMSYIYAFSTGMLLSMTMIRFIP